MGKFIKGSLIAACAFVLNGVVDTNAVAGWGGGNYHSHGGYYNRGGYYNPGGVFFGGGGWGWGGPNVVINVPTQPYYTPPPIVCERVRVCDTYTDECWIERRCD